MPATTNDTDRRKRYYSQTEAPKVGEVYYTHAGGRRVVEVLKADEGDAWHGVYYRNVAVSAASGEHVEYGPRRWNNCWAWRHWQTNEAIYNHAVTTEMRKTDAAALDRAVHG